MVRRYFY